MSTLIRPLIQQCEVVKSVPWGPHHGVRITLNIDFESTVSRQLIGKISRRKGHSSHTLHEGQDLDQTDDADPALWDEARRKCVFDGKQPRCKDGQEGAKKACSQYASAVGFQEDAVLGERVKTPLSGKFATIR